MTYIARTLSTVALLSLAAGAIAQPVFRNVDATGKVTFSDQPTAAAVAPATGAGSGAASVSNPALGYELRQVTQRYPVVLYTSAECGPCAAGRSLLITRGVPFDERTLQSAADNEAFQRLSGQNSLPMLSIGSQQLKGFSDAEWSQYLTAAGYPKNSQLPAGYRTGTAQPLVAQQPSTAQAPAGGPPSVSARPAPATRTVPSGPGPGNPAGIRF